VNGQGQSCRAIVLTHESALDAKPHVYESRIANHDIL
jgi:hypothetical protein